MLPRIVGYYIQVGSVTNDELAAECDMELIDEKELFSYIVENSEREGHFDYYEDRSKTWNCVWLQEGKLRLMLPSTIELYTNVNNLWKDNDIKLRMEWPHAINNLPSGLNLNMHLENYVSFPPVPNFN